MKIDKIVETIAIVPFLEKISTLQINQYTNIKIVRALGMGLSMLLRCNHTISTTIYRHLYRTHNVGRRATATLPPFLVKRSNLPGRNEKLR